ncbi:MAG: RluA family pseudouridine synthase [Alphaproteobacteria bacterium]|nr:RluA family pseudouridine synthase [Alphaproteobacteria bacterium]
MTKVQTVSVGADEGDLRLDRWFKRRFPELGHGRLEKLLRTGQIRVDGKRAKAGERLMVGQSVRVPPLGPAPKPDRAPVRSAPPPVDEKIAAELRSLVLYKDDELIAINKPPGLAVQGGTGTERHLDLWLDALRFDSPERPRLVHRLDRDTSGVMIVARSAAAASRLGDAFRDRAARKIYWAVTAGVPRPRQGKIDLALDKQGGAGGEKVVVDEDAGRRAVTLYTVIDAAGQRLAWVAFMPLTGRTHQIRVHARALGAPILGDGKYGGASAFITGQGLSRKLHLHARALTLPRRGAKPLRLVAPLPEHMAATWRMFGWSPDLDEDPFPASN